MAKGDIAVCLNELCRTEFVKNTFNNVYCSPECCRTATNAKLLKKYHAKKAVNRNGVRVCSRCERNKLSRYNKGSVCSECEALEKSKTRESIIERLSDGTE